MSEPISDIYCIAIGGTGMAPLACLLQGLGFRVRGSDKPLYPPMSTLLDEAGIAPAVGFDVANLDPVPDLVIVGNAVPRDNPEAVAVEERGWERISMPQALSRFVLEGRRPLVVAGTHGKTTTTSMAAWTFAELGYNPGFLIGGVPTDLGRSFELGGGSRFVIEGDEYNASYFDRGPKFLHYGAETLILTSVEHDHVDLYRTPEDLQAAFRRLVAGLPPSGHLIACGDSAEVRAVGADSPCRVTWYGFAEDNDVRVVAGEEGSRYRFRDEAGQELEVEMRMPGRHNAANALAVWIAARAEGADPRRAAEILSGFRGVMRRLEVLGTAGGVTVVDDFAHHPTAVGASIQGLRERYPGRRLVVLFEPRSITAGRDFFQRAYREAFRSADRVILAPIFYSERLAPEERLDLGRLTDELDRDGVDLEVCVDLEEVERRALALAEQGDVLVTMSSGAFGAMPRRLLEGLRSRC